MQKISASNATSLLRFVDAQASTIGEAFSELRAGRKRTHWIWFVFPQLRGLGASSMAEFYGLSSLGEARDYLHHAVLGANLDVCTRAVLSHENRSLNAIFGSPDDLKFRSSMTVFACASPGHSLFHEALDQMCDGLQDERTLSLLER